MDGGDISTLRVVAPSLTPDSYTLAPSKPAPRLAERGFSFFQNVFQNSAI